MSVLTDLSVHVPKEQLAFKVVSEIINLLSFTELKLVL